MVRDKKRWPRIVIHVQITLWESRAYYNFTQLLLLYGWWIVTHAKPNAQRCILRYVPQGKKIKGLASTGQKAPGLL